MIRAARLSVLCTLLLLGASACGHADPPPKVAAAPAPPPDPVAKRLEASLAALALPEDLVLAARWRSPGASLAQLAAWSGHPLDLAGWLGARLGQPSRPFELNAPIELLVVLDRNQDPPSLGWALSVGLVAADRMGAEPRDVVSPAGLACAESKALGAAAARLVCAPSDDQLARLLPHATRALPLAPVGDSELSISLRTLPIAHLADAELNDFASALLSQLVGVGHINERFDTQWAGVIGALAGELRFLAEDLDGASLELSLRQDEQALDLSLLAPAAAGRSTLGQLVVGSGASGLAPEEFWHAHEQSDGAGFSWAFQPAPIARLRAPLAALLGTLLDYRGVPRRLIQQARDLVSYLPMPRGPVIHASGRLPSARNAREARAPWLEALGWQLYSVRGNFSEYQYYVDTLTKSFNDPILGPQFGRLLRSAFGPKWAPESMSQRRPKLGELPHGSFVWEVTFAAPSEPPPAVSDGAVTPVEALAPAPVAAPAPGPSLSWYGVFVPDEDGVRMAFGADERFVSSLLVQPARPKASTTLAGRAGLGSLHEHRILAGGFVSLAGIEGNTGAEPSSAGAKQLGSAPHRGASPIVYRLSQPSEAWLQFTTRLGREALDDLLFLFDDARPNH
ncbi:MAG TPA: hypothetical protein VNN80_16375 [Polyangiaceae bacterium]|nr:hypothetical protein [Polyangiaceae bacterium]